MNTTDKTAGLYGLLAEFHEPHELLTAAARVREAGYRRIDAFTPFPVEGLADALGHHPTKLPLLTLMGGLCGFFGAFLMQYYATVIDYPWNVGGRPHNSWQSYVPIMFELTVLGASFFAVFGMLALNNLPQPYHPLFNVPEFKLASRDRFFLCIMAADPQFEPEPTRQFLEQLTPYRVFDVQP